MKLSPRAFRVWRAHERRERFYLSDDGETWREVKRAAFVAAENAAGFNGHRVTSHGLPAPATAGFHGSNGVEGRLVLAPRGTPRRVWR